MFVVPDFLLALLTKIINYETKRRERHRRLLSMRERWQAPRQRRQFDVGPHGKLIREVSRTTGVLFETTFAQEFQKLPTTWYRKNPLIAPAPEPEIEATSLDDIEAVG